MNPIGAAIIALLAIVIFSGSRLAAMLAFMVGVLYVSQHQQVSVAGLNMYSVRFLELAGFVRVLSRGEFSFGGINQVDRAFIAVYVFTAVVYSLRAAEGQAYIIGNSVDALLCYFTFRGLIQEADDFKLFLDAFVYLLALYAVLVVFESFTHRNPFAFEGGGMWNWMRNGRLRCVGAFRSPDLLGSVGAVFLPLYMAVACVRGQRFRAAVAIISCGVIVWSCNSGGPLSATAAGCVGWLLWRLRGRMQLFRRGLVCFILLAAILMKAPVWYLIARMSELTGGDGWHRSFLIDVSVRHLRLWWLAGLPMTETIDWFPYAFATGADITNTFISFGLNAGLGAIVLLVLVLKRAYSLLGQALQAVRDPSDKPGEVEFLLWGMGAMLGAHIVNWFGITYYDQFYVIWFMQLAAIVSVAARCVEAESNEPALVSVPADAQPAEELLQFGQ